MTDRLAESTTSYRDALAQPASQVQFPGSHLTQLNPRLKVSKGGRARQSLLDVNNLGDLETIRCKSMAEIKERVSKVLKKVGEYGRFIQSGYTAQEQGHPP